MRVVGLLDDPLPCLRRPTVRFDRAERRHTGFHPHVQGVDDRLDNAVRIGIEVKREHVLAL